jgi:hypothetical protein
VNGRYHSAVVVLVAGLASGCGGREEAARAAAGEVVEAGAAAAEAADRAPGGTVYEYVYEFSTPELNENHYIVLDSAVADVRGWYYGTSDEFDVAREGCLPGFFVAETTELDLSPDSLTFVLIRPDTLFTAPVPLQYRSAGEVPPALLEVWPVTLPAGSKRYAGAVAADRILFTSPERVFLRMARDGL